MGWWQSSHLLLLSDWAVTEGPGLLASLSDVEVKNTGVAMCSSTNKLVQYVRKNTP